MQRDFFDDPILNSPYFLPKEHWELDEDNRPTNRVIGIRRSSELLTALPEAYVNGPPFRPNTWA
jgi:hypothetical protein